MLTVNTQLCDQCGTCISVCPSNALLLSQILEIDRNLCTQCQTCVKICPFGALSINTNISSNESNS